MLVTRGNENGQKRGDGKDLLLLPVLFPLRRFQQVNNFTAELQAKPEYHKFLIGRGGANIRRVRDKTGARIIFPSPDDTEQELITIVGKEEAVRQAQKELESLVKNLVITHCTISPSH